MRRSSRCAGAWSLVAWLSVSAWAQPPAHSVADLIESIKAQKELALNPPSQGARAKRGPDAVADTDSPPLLWSVSGLNEDYSAVLVIDRKVYTVRSTQLPRRVGGWRVHHIGAQSVCVSLRGEPQCLQAPDSATTAHAFVQALPAAGAGKAEASLSMNESASTAAESAAQTVGADKLSQALATRLPSLPVTPR